MSPEHQGADTYDEQTILHLDVYDSMSLQHIGWLQGISPRERIARGLCKRVDNAINHNKARPDASWIAGRPSAIQDAARQHGIQVRIAPQSGKVQGFDNERRPTATRLIDAQLRECCGQNDSQAK